MNKAGLNRACLCQEGVYKQQIKNRYAKLRVHQTQRQKLMGGCKVSQWFEETTKIKEDASC
jgi:hypothetical protein